MTPVSSEQEISESIQALESSGFINYFGMQRFGTSSISTPEIGIQILKEDFEKACDFILLPKGNEDGRYHEARQHWQQHKDPKSALQLFPRNCIAERAILEAFSRSGSVKDCKTAIRAVSVALFDLIL